MANFQGSKINPTRFSSGQLKFHAVAFPLAIAMIIPIVYIVCQAFKPLGEMYRFPPTIIVRKPTLSNFKNLFEIGGATGIPMSRYFFNSILVAVATVVINVVITIMAAYVFAKKKFAIKGALWGINQLALMFVPTAVAVPRYMIISSSGLVNTWWAHIFPLVAVPVGLFLVKQFVDGIPDALIEAAVMDGAGDLTIIRKVIVPLTKPALATSIVLTFQQVWNNVETSNNFITEESMRTINFFASSLQVNNAVAAAGIGAAAQVLIFLPNLIIFICMQSQVMNTMSHSGI
ncbi:MAG: carbohydrate ABC transporter permease, partial [Lachnospiraceae bacterium]|nr:carbohydrate ABC transporter permease [Lachnospiraceae bacterium]